MPQWYYTQDGQQRGPTSFSELQRLAYTGQLKPSDLVYEEGTPNWVTAGAVSDLLPRPTQDAAIVTPIADVQPMADARPIAPGEEDPALVIFSRIFTWNLSQVRIAPSEQSLLRQAGIVSGLVARYMVWRRSILLFVLVLSAVSAILSIINTITNVTTLPEELSNFIRSQFQIQATVKFNAFGVLLIIVTVLALLALPVFALLAFIFWSRLKLSRSLVFWGWMISFVIPLVVLMVPITALVTFEGLEGSLKAIIAFSIRAMFALAMIIFLSPIVLSVTAGLIGSCARYKTLQPSSTIAGWLTMGFAVLHMIVIAVLIVEIHAFVPNPLLILTALLWIGAAISYVVMGRAFVQPLSDEECRARIGQVRLVYLILTLAGVATLIAYLFTAKVGENNLVSFSKDEGLLTPWKLLELLLGYAARTPYMAVLVFDVLLRANATEWTAQAQFRETAAAEVSNKEMQLVQESLR